MSETTEVKALAPKLHFGRVFPAGHVYNSWEADIGAETTREMLRAPTFWTHYSQQFKARDLLVCVREDGAWEAWLRVRSVEKNEVVVDEILFHEYSNDVPLASAGEYETRWRGPAAKFGVLRKADGALIKDGFYPKDTAVTFMKTLAKAAA
jgi:hypothetical protein